MITIIFIDDTTIILNGRSGGQNFLWNRGLKSQTSGILKHLSTSWCFLQSTKHDNVT